MAENQKITIQKWLLQNFFSVAAVIVALANLWLFSKLAPFTQDINNLKNKVLANETRINNTRMDWKNARAEMMEELKYIRTRVDQLYMGR